MKNQYVGDIGDYGKYALLRAFVNAGVSVGVNWYLTDNDGSNDGRFIYYLNEDRMRWYDSEVFDVLKKIAHKKDKSVKDIQKSGILSGAAFYDEKLGISGSPKAREDFRNKWFENSIPVMKDVQLIFMDPDNGLLESGNATKLGAEKYILPEEAEKYFSLGHDVVYYCHKGRRSYDAWQGYISFMFDRIPEAKPAVLTYHKGSQRSYVFLIHEEHFIEYRQIIESFKHRWTRLFSEEKTNRGDTAGAEEGTITVEKSDGTKATVSRRADGKIAVTSSKNPDSTMVISPDLFCSSIGV